MKKEEQTVTLTAKETGKLDYKKTKLGWIPEEWEVVRLKDIATVGNGTTPSRKNKDYWTNGNIPWLPTGKVNEKEIYNADEFITEKALKETSLKILPVNTVLIGMIGQGKTRGMAAITKIEATVNQNFAYIINNEKLNPTFLFNKLSFDYKHLRGSGRGGGQESLNCKIIKRYLIPLPPLPEQQKIAAILSTWDKAIDLTQQLIAAKEEQKKGLMQRLLTGKIRLNRFEKTKGSISTRIGLVPKDWRTLKSSEIFKNISIKNNNGRVLLAVTQENGVIPRDQLAGRVTMPSGSTSSYKLVLPGNFVISLRSFQGGLEYSEYEGIVSPAYTVLTNIIQIDDTFFKFFFKSKEFISRLSVAVIGIRDGKQISFSDFSALTFRYPPIEEQEAIGTILNNADDEIKMLKRKIDIFKEQKKGLMQQLLTGKVRTNSINI